MVVGYRFIGDAGHAGGQQVLRLLRIRCQMQVSEQDLLTPAQTLPLDGLGFLHLHDHVGGSEYLLGRCNYYGASGGVIVKYYTCSSIIYSR